MALTFVKKPPAIGLKIQSFTKPYEYYYINFLTAECQCPKFKKDAKCKHLEAVGLFKSPPFTPRTNPTYSQALSAVVKSVRLRRVEEAIYWMVYLDTFPETKGERFRLARRLLILSAEDGHNIPTMKKIATELPKLSQKTTSLVYLVGEALRICKSPNWWDPQTGGHDYLYHSLIGQRLWWQKKWYHKREEVEEALIQAFDTQDKALAIGAVISYGVVKSPGVGTTKQAEWLLEQATLRNHEAAIALCTTHLLQKSALSGDNNILSQAAWMLAGGVSPIAMTEKPGVTYGEAVEALKKAQEQWKTPHTIPTWCCDGIHCAGNDPRFAGVLPLMYSVCLAYKKYGRVDPDDAWGHDLYCLDGLNVEKIGW